MIMIIALVILVVIFILAPRDSATIEIKAADATANFDTASALAYADRVSRIAELAVGGVLTLAIGLIGFSWVSNNARIERDRQELADHKSKFEVQLDDRIASVSKQLEALRRELEIRIGASADERRILGTSVEEDMIISMRAVISKRWRHMRIG